MLETASTGLGRGLSLVRRLSARFKPISPTCFGFLRTSTAWPVVLKTLLIPHSYFAGTPTHETCLPLIIEDLISVLVCLVVVFLFSPEPVFFLSMERFYLFLPCDFSPKRNHRYHLQAIRYPQPHDQSPASSPPAPRRGTAAEVTELTLPPPREPSRIGAVFFERYEQLRGE